MPSEHTVRAGDCVSSIAFDHGFFPDTVWDDAANAKLKEMRKNPNILVPGDVVVVPDKQPREESGATESLHRFRRKGVPERLKIRLEENGEPRAKLAYTIVIEGRSTQGTTDDEGWIDHPIPPNAKRGTLSIEGEAPLDLYVGHMPPIDTDEGLLSRLGNLGYIPADGDDPDGDFESERLANALSHFQARCGLTVSGTADDETKQKLLELHQS